LHSTGVDVGSSEPPGIKEGGTILSYRGQSELAHKNVDAGKAAIQRFVEFFTANIRNPNTM
jgi:hypothetical protein